MLLHAITTKSKYNIITEYKNTVHSCFSMMMIMMMMMIPSTDSKTF